MEVWVNTRKYIHTRAVLMDEPNLRFGDYEFVKSSHVGVFEQPMVVNFADKLWIVL